MATSPDSIRRFLSIMPTPGPDVKDTADEDLYGMIRRLTGVPFKPKTTPRQHQLASVAFLCAQRQVMLFVGLRMGKTATTLYSLEHLKRAGLAKRGLVITPNPVLRPVWVNETAKHTDLCARAVTTDPNDFLRALEEPNDLIVASWSGLQQLFTMRQPKGKGKGNEMVPDFEALNAASEFFDFFAIDEIHTAKNQDSLRFCLGSELSKHSPYCLGLTGTPFGRNIFDLWAQCFLIDGGAALSSSYYFFRTAFGKKVATYRPQAWYIKNAKSQVSKAPEDRGPKEWTGDADKLDIMREKLAGLALIYENTEIKDQIEPAVVALDMVGEQREAYETIISEAVAAKIEGLVATQNIYTQLRSVASGYLPYKDDEGRTRYYEFPQNPKMEWLAEAFSAAPGVRAILFHVYTHTGDMLCRMLSNKKISHTWLHGGITSPQQNKAVSDFQTGKAQVLVINAASGNAGLDFKVADWQCYVESPSSAIQRQQSEGRALGDRGGRPLLMDDLVSAKVELKVLDYVKQGRDLLQTVIFNPEELL
jgi:hypothetical protein